MDYLIFEFDGNIRLFFALATLDALVFVTLFLSIGTLLARVGPKGDRHRTVLFRLLLFGLFLQYYLLLRWRVKSHPSILLLWIPVLVTISAFLPLCWTSVHRRATAAFVWLVVRASMTRVCSCIFACSALIVFALPGLAIAILMKLLSPGPVFVRQSRLRYDGKTITLIKFRTKIVETSDYNWSAFRSTSINSLRITRVGWWLRLSGMYRLPMLWSVIKGDIELFGLTPLMQEHLQDAEVSHIVKRHFRAASQFYCLTSEGDSIRAVAMRFPVGMIPYSVLHAYHLKLGKRLFIRQLDIKPYMLEESEFFVHPPFPMARLWARCATRIIGMALCALHILNYREYLNSTAVAEGAKELALQ